MREEDFGYWLGVAIVLIIVAPFVALWNEVRRERSF